MRQEPTYTISSGRKQYTAELMEVNFITRVRKVGNSRKPKPVFDSKLKCNTLPIRTSRYENRY